MDNLETAGQFWSPDDDTKRINGVLAWESGSRARLVLESRVIDELASPVTFTDTGFSIAHSGDPAANVADSVARLILGDTDLGAVTCVDSYLQYLPRDLMDFTTPFQQVWDPYTLIVGAHLADGHATELGAVRFVLDSPEWWSHLPDGGTASDTVGEISCQRTAEGQTWLEFRPSFALTLHSADRAVLSVITLAKLALDAELTPIRVQVREPGQTNWLEVRTASEDTNKTSGPGPGNLLSSASLTLERIVRWLTIEQTMDGLAAAVADPVKEQAIQVHALVACSLVEGIHKRIDGRERTYRERAGDLLVTAQQVVGDITDPVADWAKLVLTARNDLAHHNTGRTFEAQYLNWIIAETSVIWVLRLCLLDHAGFPAEDVRTALADHQRYGFYRENLKMHVRELDA